MTAQRIFHHVLRLFGTAACIAVCIVAYSQTIKDGKVRHTDGFEVWSERHSAWITPLEFWHDYARQNGGLTFGTRDTYPEYASVKEHDLMIIEVHSGPCLMEFFHRRWRRANDVRRWDEQFNQLGGCPNVFD